MIRTGKTDEPVNSTDLKTEGESHANTPGTPETPVEEGTYVPEGGLTAAPGEPATVEGQAQATEGEATEEDAD